MSDIKQCLEGHKWLLCQYYFPVCVQSTGKEAQLLRPCRESCDQFRTDPQCKSFLSLAKLLKDLSRWCPGKRKFLNELLHEGIDDCNKFKPSSQQTITNCHLSNEPNRNVNTMVSNYPAPQAAALMTSNSIEDEYKAQCTRYKDVLDRDSACGKYMYDLNIAVSAKKIKERGAKIELANDAIQIFAAVPKETVIRALHDFVLRKCKSEQKDILLGKIAPYIHLLNDSSHCIDNHQWLLCQYYFPCSTTKNKNKIANSAAAQEAINNPIRTHSYIRPFGPRATVIQIA